MDYGFKSRHVHRLGAYVKLGLLADSGHFVGVRVGVSCTFGATIGSVVSCSRWSAATSLRGSSRLPRLLMSAVARSDGLVSVLESDTCRRVGVGRGWAARG